MSMPEQEQIVPQSLGLEDGNDMDDQPRRFLRLPSGHLLAYGGDNGNVSCLVSGRRDTLNIGEKNEKFVIVQRYEDAIRCIAVSKDGKRLAIGFDTGKTLIHRFDEFSCQDNDFNNDRNELPVHPYVKALVKAQSSKGIDDDFLLSQDCSSGENDFDSFAGPDLGAPARDMLFIPHTNGAKKASSSENPYSLAIASEAGMFVIDVTDKEIMDGCDHWLEVECKESHDQCGIRGLDVGIIENFREKKNESSEGSSEIVVLASLAMDGRLCLWDFTNKKLLQREDTRCVAKKDVGEIHDADAYDRSCRPTIFSFHGNNQQKLGLIIATPGKLMPCTRVLKLDGDDRKIKLLSGLSFQDDKNTENGHIQPTVKVLFCSDSLLVTSGQDGRLLLWSARPSKAGAQKESSLGPNDNFALKWEVVKKFQLESPATDLCVQHQSADTVSLFSACANGSLKVFDISSHCYLNNAAPEKSSISKETTKGNDEKQSPTSIIVATDSQRTFKKLDARTNLKKMPLSSDSDEDDSILSSAPKSKNVHFLDEAEEEKDVENLDESTLEAGVAPSSSGKPGSFDHYSDDEDSNSLVDHSLVPKQSTYIDTVKLQPAFSPSSTPLDLTRRFLCWNHIGSVTLLQGDNNRNIIDINFADSAFKRPISFTDNINFIIGSVGESGGIFASDTKDDDEDMDGEEIDRLDEFNMSERTKQAVLRDQKKSARNSENSKPTGSSIFFYRFHTSKLVNHKNKDWHLILPDGERVLGAACGDGWAAAMTR